MPELPVVLDARVVTGVGGGPEKTILNSPRFLRPAGYRMLCAYMNPPGDPGFDQLMRRADALEATLVSVPDRGPWDLGVLGHMLRICRRERVAIWHGHDYKSNLIGLLLRPFWPMRLVTTVHGWVHRTRRTPLYYAIDQLCLPRYERVICVSDDLFSRCLSLGVPPDRCMLIENGIDTDQFARRTDKAEAKRRLGIAPDRFVVGAAGRLSAEKGFDLLIRALGALLESGRDLTLLVAGEGDERARIEALIGELSLGDRVRLMGFQADVLPLFEAIDVFALSSLREGLPNVVLEAMAIGVPVVATRIAGIHRLIREGENGLTVEPGSVDALARAIGWLQDHPDSRVRLGSAGRESVESRHDFGARMRRMADVYDELLGLTAEATTAGRSVS
ncbi:glycosyltransferase (plasmid) [Tundrisphaera lichenicola]|uniref:glycosyltransferase n=1 Tax=Tundrisphaera lichenicola TaxID=2029860 RepID=UPI003EB74916